MPRREIILEPGQCYHVYNRGANRAIIYFNRDNYLFFLRRLREKLVDGEVNESERRPAFAKSRASGTHATILAYCLMPNHYHLLLRIESEQFSERMQAFGTSYSKALNKQTGRSGTLFQGRFQAKHIDEEGYLVHLSRYIHLNPVAAQLVLNPTDWEFSRFREYLGLRDGTLPCTEILLREFQSREHYRRFVETGRPESAPSIDHLLFGE